ncbi:MAG: putative membrane protein [Rhodobacteraceae bacterium HLUCCA12]|nr:MAG: putative membrane protein [Rhodobacteraceae bacterium HLUCCA12]
MAISGDILRSYRAPRMVLRERMAGERREGRALVYLMIACALIFVAQWPRLARQAHLSPEVPFDALLAGALFGWMFLAPLFFYGIGALLGMVLKLLRRGADAFAARLALFWALLAASPLVLAQGLVAAFAGPGALSVATGLVVIAVFLAILLAGLAEALEARQGAA